MEYAQNGSVIGNEIGIPDGKGGLFKILAPGEAENLEYELKNMKPDQQKVFIADMVKTHNEDRWRRATIGIPVRRAVCGLGKEPIAYYPGEIVAVGKIITAEIDIDPSQRLRINYDSATGIDLNGLQFGWLTT